MKIKNTLALCLGMLAWVPTSAWAATEPMAGTVVDQSNLQTKVNDWAFFGQHGTHVKDTALQTFTAGMDGTLAQIGLRLWKRGTTVGSMDVHFYKHGLVGGSPEYYPAAAAVRTLDYATLGVDAPLDVTYFDFSGAGIHLEQGGVYSFMLTNSSPYEARTYQNLREGGVAAASVKTYAGGALYEAPNWGLGYQAQKRGLDLDFVTTMFADEVAAVPEPASWAMMIVGFGAAGAALRRRPHARVQAV